ncbi:helix-turn-helix domain-containing protein [Micromonospora sp. NBC_01699]|uniref:helix-turn-helix domain-containing protein n=1 Tax=Micromonospora sp. NBC_01699 TaxID=2975984 RepID=UPI002E2913BC|nr:helix-turn-helix domain-containing protein [Micromonospora sp. NBC_01699]
MDPTAGPLSSFAYELRKLRAETGNLTYRRLAGLAGYSPSTLSAAASGTRQPSLDVVLAYVGACGGDTAQWRQRWLDLDAALRAAAPTAASDPPTAPTETGPAESGEQPQPATPEQPAPLPAADAEIPTTDPGRADAEPGNPGRPPAEPTDPGQADGHGGVPRRRKVRRWLALAGVAVAGLAGTAAVVPSMTGVRWPSGAEPTAHAPTTAPTTATACPPPAANPTFTAVTYGSGAHVRGEPRRDTRIMFTLPPGCTVGFTGYCLGEKISDSTAHTPDVRWFALAGGGYVASGVVHGNPPADLGPSRCAGDRPGPASITLMIAPDTSGPDRLRVSATGTHLEIVGFAAYYADDPALPADRRWHQLALTGTATPAFEVTWPLDRLPARPGPGDGIPVAAVACLGGGAPTDVVDLRLARADGTGAPEPFEPTADQLLAARRTACLYP